MIAMNADTETCRPDPGDGFLVGPTADKMKPRGYPRTQFKVNKNMIPHLKIASRALTTTCFALAFCSASQIKLRAQTNDDSALTVTNKFYSSSGKWFKTSNANCLIWNSFPHDGETVTWSGGVVDGKAAGTGIVQWLTNGIPTSKYEGEMKSGLSDGHGIMDGHGETTEGEFKQGCLVSTNIMIHYSDGGSYKGQAKDGFKEGEGQEMMKGGVKYTGHFVHDRFNGTGEMLWPSGDKLTGNWKNSVLSGVGTYKQSTGQSFSVKMTDKGIEPYVEAK
jgi:hypothetical protein